MPSRGSGLARKLLVRLAWTLPTLIFISLVTFAAGYFAPRDPATLLAGEHASIETVTRLRHQMGLDRPFFVRYSEYVLNAAKGDLGESLYNGNPKVSNILMRGIRYTGMLALFAIIFASFAGIILGTIASVWQNRWPDNLSVTFSTFGLCIPSFVLAPVLAFIFVLNLHWLPYVTWRDDAQLASLILPVFILSLRPAALITRLTRASMIDTLGQDFIRTAFAKGVPFWRVIWVHAFRNSLVPIVTAIGTTFGFLLTGSFIIESAFNIPGLGLSSIEAINQSDYPVIQGTVMLFAATFILVNLIVDLVLPLIDPRIREAAA